MPSHSVLNFNPLLRKSYELQQFDWFHSYWYFEFSYAIIQLWYALAKTLSEQAAWALAMDRLLCMVSINAGLVLGPAVTQQNPQSTMFYLKGRDAHTSHSIVTLSCTKFMCTCCLTFIICWFTAIFDRGSSNVRKRGPGICRCKLLSWCPYSSIWGSINKWSIFLLQSDCEYWGRSFQACTKLEPFDTFTTKVA